MSCGHRGQRKQAAVRLRDVVELVGREYVGQVIAPAGNNLHRIRRAGEPECLASMPTRFRKIVWIKRGDYVVIDPIDEGDKVQGEIVAILQKQQIRHLKQLGQWPALFTEEPDASKGVDGDEAEEAEGNHGRELGSIEGDDRNEDGAETDEEVDEGEDDSDDGLPPPNMNRRGTFEESDDSDSESDED